MTKRERPDDGADAVGLNDDDIDGFLQGNSNEDDEERRRRERAAKRRQRLKRIRQQEQEGGGVKRTKHGAATASNVGSGSAARNRSVNVSATTTSQTSTRPEGDIKSGTDSNRVSQPPDNESEAQPADKSKDDDNNNDNDDDDSFDMFTSSVSPPTQDGAKNESAVAARESNKVDDFQDSEGYYKAVIGETLRIDRYGFVVQGVVGKGVFSTVLKCTTTTSSSSSSIETTSETQGKTSGETKEETKQLPPTVALKCIRNNETMAKAAMNEIQVLQTLSAKVHPHVVQLLLPSSGHPVLEHRGHVILCFEYQPFNLRDVLQKFGKGVGLNLAAVVSYFRQLLLGLRHLEKNKIIHADLKPDNILVDGGFGHCRICDFGSAVAADSPDASIVTPYMVSRFYRAPEVILGQPATSAIDLWSMTVTVAELFAGKVMFAGKTNNDMLYRMMDKLGVFAHKTIRQHVMVANKLNIPAHFELQQRQFVFLQKTDAVAANGKQIVKQVSLHQQGGSAQGRAGFPTKPLHKWVMQQKSSGDSRSQIEAFSDLLQKILMLEPSKRITTSQALQHKLFEKL